MRKFIEGLLFGSMLGGVFALLKNPNTGKENREILKTYLNDTAASMRSLEASLKSSQSALTGLATEGTKTVKLLQEELLPVINDFKHISTPHFNRMQERLAIMNEHLDEAKVRLAAQEEFDEGH